MKGNLRDIDVYLKKMVHTIHVVTGLHSLIADKSGYVVADSAEPENFQGVYLSQSSILINCLKQKEVVVLYRPKENLPSCINCKKKSACDVLSTIEVPIICQGSIFGAITLHASTEEKEAHLVKNEKTYLIFLQDFAELVINQLLIEEDRKLLKTRIKSLTNNNYITNFDSIIGSSKEMIAVKKLAKEISHSTSTIMISGESGTGKEILARAIHNNSTYGEGPFIPVNCAAIPDNLLESELFGYEEGAFTGSAKGGQIGKFELANQGTLFLDEVGEIPIHLQAKLLRAIQEKRIQRLGAKQDKALDFRIISATNRDLESMVENGKFRKDLYYRLNVIPIYIPPLRERKVDIKDTLNYLIQRFNSSFHKSILGFSPDAEMVLLSYDWPGNVRELQNIVEYSMNMVSDQWIKVGDLPKRLISFHSNSKIIVKPLREVETDYIIEALHFYGKDTEGKRKASKALGISLSTLYRKIEEYQIEVD